MHAQVLIEINTSALDKTFTYKIPNGMKLKKGQRVIVPFGNRKLEGFILNITEETKDEYKLKEIIKVIDEQPVINAEMLELGKYISKKTLSPLISAYQTMLPRALKAKYNTKINKKIVTYLKIEKEIELTSEAQKKVFTYIKNNSPALKNKARKISSSALNTLIKKGAITEEQKEVYRINEKINIKKQNYNLTEQQKQVIKAVDLNTFKPYLLHGVTGSGKTYVYIKLIEKVIEKQKQAILLVPEISLTPQVASTFKKHFGSNVAVLHSALNDGEKYDEWRKIERKEVDIVIGARSAIFAPFTDIGIIIIDEEHATTYKQESTPKYDTVTIAIKRAKTHNCPLLLGSATPSIESYTRAKAGIYHLLEIKQRINHQMPQVYLVNMQDEFKKGNRIFSEILKQKINQTIEEKKQVMILLNRRGYSTVMTCKECGYTHKCPNCDIPYTYHKKTNTMQCHYCSKIEPKILICPQCHSKHINQMGMGTEKLEELVNQNFNNAKTIRMDIDTTRKKGMHSKIIGDFANQKYNVLIGTQMITKGLDFPNVTLVAVINADASLNIPDFRSAERTYHMLSQVAGRAGRAQHKGEVIIQGFNLDHYSIIAAKNHDYQMFYKEEIKIRKILKYPPFYNLSHIKISGKKSEEVKQNAIKIAKFLKTKLPHNIILGPAALEIPKINNIYYFGIIIKYKNTKDLLKPLEFIISKYKTNNKIKIDIDLTPIKI